MSRELAPMDKLRTSIESIKDKLAEVAPSSMDVGRLVRLMLAAVSKTPKILECTTPSIMLFCMKCAETGLEPIGAGGCWPVPYENRKAGTIELQFIPDYRGLVNAAKRAGAILHAKAEVVYEFDEFDYELGLRPDLRHKPIRGDRGNLDAAYLVYVLPDGTREFVVMDRAEIESIRKRSRAANSGPWVTDPGEMWKKTVTRRGMKPFAGMSTQLDAAIDSDADAFTEREPIEMPRAIDEPKPAQSKRRGGRKADAVQDAPAPEEMDDAGPIPEAAGVSMEDWQKGDNPAR